MDRKRSGFSLLELLIVVAIMAILAGVLMATFTLVERQSRNLTCFNNVRQMMQGVLLYTNYQADGFFPDFQNYGEFNRQTAQDGWVLLADLAEGDLYTGAQSLSKVFDPNVMGPKIWNGFTVVDTPRKSSPILRCSEDTHLYINGQGIPTSYVANPQFTFAYLPDLKAPSKCLVLYEGTNLVLFGDRKIDVTRQDIGRIVIPMPSDLDTEEFSWVKGLSNWGDIQSTFGGYFGMNSWNCGCRIWKMVTCTRISKYHFNARGQGGGHGAFADGSIQLIVDDPTTTAVNERDLAYWNQRDLYQGWQE